MDLGVQDRSVQAAKRTAVLAIAGAALFALGALLPYVSAGGESISLADGGSEVYLLFVLPAAMAAVLAVMGFAGRPLLAGVAAGAVIGMMGVTVSILAVIYKLVDQVPGTSLGIGFYSHTAAVTSALAAVGASLGGGRAPSAPVLNQGLCLLAAAAFLGVPASLLLSRRGSSVWDIDDGTVKLGVIVWAVVPAAVGIYAVLTRRPAAVAVAVGVAVGLLGMVLFDLTRDDSGTRDLLSGFEVRYPGLYNLTVLAALALSAVALLTGGSAAVAAPAAAAAVSYAAPGQTPAAGWAPDPYGRHGQRYWDGHQWTAYVDDGGVSGTDPIAPAAPPTAPLSAATRMCPNGHANPAAGAFCTQCGMPLGSH